MMTFEEFQATRTLAADIGPLIPEELLVPQPGYVYCEKLFIEIHGRRFHLCIGNWSKLTFDLEELERKLYEFGCTEGYCD